MAEKSESKDENEESEDLSEIQEVFEEIDENYSGDISLIELQTYLNKLGKRGHISCKMVNMTDHELCIKNSIDKQQYYIWLLWGENNKNIPISNDEF